MCCVHPGWRGTYCKVGCACVPQRTPLSVQMQDMLDTRHALPWSACMIDRRLLQGNCSGDVAANVEFIADEALLPRQQAPPLLPPPPQQCLLVSSTSILAVLGTLWLDGLYFRMHAPHAEGQPGRATGVSGPVAVGEGPAAALYMTGCTLQGDVPGEAPAKHGRGMHLEGGMYAEGAVVALPPFQMHVAVSSGNALRRLDWLGMHACGLKRTHCSGCIFDSLGGSVLPIEVESSSAAASFVACEFQYCHGSAKRKRGRSRSTLDVTAEERHVIAVRAGAAARLEQSRFRKNPVEHALAAAGAGSVIFADDDSLTVQRTGGPDPPQALDAARADAAFLTGNDTWLQETREVRTLDASANHPGQRWLLWGIPLGGSPMHSKTR